MERHIAIAVADGFTDSGLSVALDVLRTVNALAVRRRGSAPFRIDVVSAHGGPVRAASGLVIERTRPATAALGAHVVLVPGLWFEDAAEVDAAFERDDVRRLVKTITAAHRKGAIVGSSCSGAFLLAEAGLLDGREATTTWWLAPHLKRRRPQVDVNAERSLVVHPRVICAGAVLAQADLMLHLVSRFCGPTTARRCAGLLLLDRHASQAAYMALEHLSANDPTVRRAEVWVRSHLSERFDVAQLARQVGTSQRTLARRLTAAVGVSAIGFVQRLRVEAAIHLLETTRRSLDEISALVGYSNGSTLSRLIERETNATPRELRRRQPAATRRKTTAGANRAASDRQDRA